MEEAQPDDILELDELWSFVYEKTNQQWLWSALCRRTRQVVAYVIGDHSMNTCRRLFKKIPYEYRKCHSFSDFWKTYKAIMPEQTHQCVGKESGKTAHMERWYNTLRQRNARDVRKTLSFSKSEEWHHMVTKLLITNLIYMEPLNHLPLPKLPPPTARLTTLCTISTTSRRRKSKS